jgi:hypothetical protein
MERVKPDYVIKDKTKRKLSYITNQSAPDPKFMFFYDPQSKMNTSDTGHSWSYWKLYDLMFKKNSFAVTD